MDKGKEINSLAELLEAGALTKDEFENAKSAILGDCEANSEDGEAGVRIETQVRRSESDAEQHGRASNRHPGKRWVVPIATAVLAFVAVVGVVSFYFGTGAARVGFDGGSVASESAPTDVGKSEAGEADLSVYDSVLRAYKEMTANNNPVYGGDMANPNILSGLSRDLSAYPVYSFVDLAQDGVPELAVAVKYSGPGNGSGTSGTSASYRLYGLLGIRDARVAHLEMFVPDGKSNDNVIYSAAFGESYACVFCEGGIVHGRNGEDIRLGDSGYWHLPSDSVTFQLVERTWKEEPYSTSVLHQNADGDVKEITPEESSRINAAYVPDESIDWIPLASFDKR